MLPPSLCPEGAALIFVIGSGPAGVSAARALLDRHLAVTLVDAGIEMEPEARSLRQELAAAAPGAWSAELVARARRRPRTALGGVPLKAAFGSDFAYREVERLLPFENRGSAVRPTLARGGFSGVWGAAVLPTLAEDLAGWPLAPEALAPHYRAVARFLPLAGVRDDLAEELPLHADSPGDLAPSPQARALLDDLGRRRERLRRAG